MATTNKRAQMVKGSTWRVTQDATIERLGPNPAFAQAVSAKQEELKPSWRAKTIEWADLEKLARKHAKSLGLPENIAINTVDVKAGDIIEITGSSTNAHWTRAPYQTFIGIYFPVKIGNRAGWLPYAGFEPIVELDKAVTVEEWVIRDTATGKFFGGTEYVDTVYAEPDATGYRSWHYHYNAKFADTFMKAKRFKDLSKAKMSVMSLNGYYDGLPGSENLPDWVGGPKVMDIPETWEFVKFDKVTKTEIETVDLQAWHKRLWELRELTVRFGSPVRTLYNDLEKKDKLDEFSGMLVVRAPVETSAYWGASHTHYTKELDPKVIEEVDSVIAQFGLKKADIKRAKDPNCVAIAFKGVRTALKFKLSYNGPLSFNVLDLTTLKEVVDA